MSEIHRVKVTIEKPHGDFPGRVSYGYFTLEGNKLTMTGENGQPIIDRLGIRYERTLQNGQDPYALACHLTREIRRKVTGNGGFNRDIHYPRLGVA